MPPSIPLCRSEAHPPDHRRNTMRVAEETAEWVSFICTECHSLQVRTLDRGKQRARYSLQQVAGGKLLEDYKLRRRGRVYVHHDSQ